MTWLWHRNLDWFVAPPCMCDEIEAHVREAIAIRDEMAKWPTPLDEWRELQEMPVLKLRSEPEQPKLRDRRNRPLAIYARQPVVVPPPPRSGDHAPITIFDGVPGSIGLAPGEEHMRVGDILGRGNGRYQIVGLEVDGFGARARVIKLRD